MNRAIWVKGERKQTGSWFYNWAADYFVIRLDSRDTITGRQRVFRVFDETPEWHNWKLQKRKKTNG